MEEFLNGIEAWVTTDPTGQVAGVGAVVILALVIYWLFVPRPWSPSADAGSDGSTIDISLNWGNNDRFAATDGDSDDGGSGDGDGD